MASRIIEVNTSTLKADVESIQGEIRAIQSAAVKLRDIAAQLGDTWDGEAKKAFMEALLNDIDRLEDLTSAVERFTGKTDNSRAEYEKCESTVSQIVSAIKV